MAKGHQQSLISLNQYAAYQSNQLNNLQHSLIALTETISQQNIQIMQEKLLMEQQSKRLWNFSFDENMREKGTSYGTTIRLAYSAYALLSNNNIFSNTKGNGRNTFKRQH